MRNIIRIEAPDGMGIFVNTAINKKGREVKRKYPNISYIAPAVLRRHNDNMPIPHQDNKLWNKFLRGEHYCGYKSIKQLREFITKEELEKLFMEKYKVFKLKVKHCHVGESQVIFKKKDVISKKNISKKLI